MTMAGADDVTILLGSKSDLEVAQKCADVLKEFGVPHSIRVASAHRTPQKVLDIVAQSKAKVFVCMAGMSNALAGFVAAHTTRPVIGVPLSGKVPLDSLLSTVQMPPGVPVATVGVDRGENAALLAVQIMAVSNRDLDERLKQYRKAQGEKVEKDDSEVRGGR
jgi:5-(carboxyamino)imidazole ribonucleotide mutase